ncbi:MAG: protein kinase, partial [Verrucomicrobiota bacterium]
MNPDRQVEIDLFNAALEIESPVERARFLDQACANDAERRHRVEALLRSFECADAIFGGTETRPVASIENDPLTEGPGTCIGPYKLLQKIGEGGMGVVYMAQQEHPIQRKVALKIIKVGMDTRQVVARFEAERQALAMMDHPNIARVFDGGCTDSGRPYFVMELVQGVPITEFCDKNKLSPLERINLFIPVCRAIQSAHQKGIIHRDIKPSNVLVTLHHGEPMPKVIDFGVAKATNQKLTEKTLFTNYATMIGTPAYMSPEQAEMSSMDVDTRTDIYSLGVLLYELLTGTTPFDQKQLLSKGFGEMQRIIAEEEPQRPSIRASTMEAEKQTTVARNRRLASAALETALKGDLDWITMKCLEKDRRRRYETPNELIADLLKHLNHEPVSAAAPTVGYRMQKFYQRNRALVHAAVAIGIILVMATLISVSMAIRMSQLRNEALRAQKNAEIQAEIAEAVNKFLNEDLLEQADPWNEPDPEVKLRTVVDRAARSIEGKFKEQPLVEAAIRLTLSGIYRSLDDGEAARRHGNRAREIYERELGKEHPLTLKALLGLVGDLIQGAQTDHAKADEASALAEEVHSIANRMLGPEHAITLDALRKRAAALGESFRFKEQRTLLDDALARHERVLGKNRPETIELLIQSSENYTFFCENSKTVDQAKEAVARSEALRPDHPLRFAAKERLSRALGVRIGNWEERRRLAEETKEFAMRVFGPKHWKTLSALGACIEADISYPGAADLAAETLEYARKRFGPNDRRTLLVQRTVALIYSRNENRDRAEELYLSGLAILNAHFKPHDPIRLHYLIRTGYFYGGSGMGLPPVAEKMEPYYREAASVALAVYGEQSWPYLMALNSLRELYTRQKNWRAAAEVNEVLLRIEKRIDDNGVKGTTGTSMKLLQCLLALEENEKAGALLQSTLESFLEQPPASTKEWEPLKPLLNAAEYYPGRQTLFSS